MPSIRIGTESSETNTKSDQIFAHYLRKNEGNSLQYSTCKTVKRVERRARDVGCAVTAVNDRGTGREPPFCSTASLTRVTTVEAKLYIYICE